MRPTDEIATDLERVRARRQELYHVQGEPLGADSAEPTNFSSGAPGGEIADLLVAEARLVLEMDDVARSTGNGERQPDRDEVATAHRTLERAAPEGRG